MTEQEKIPIVAATRLRSGILYTINFDQQDDTCQSVNVTKVDYPTVTSAIIRHRYPDDDMTAVINNYLLSPDDDVAKSEFGAMQEWRKHAKEVAKAAVEEYGRLYPYV